MVIEDNARSRLPGENRVVVRDADSDPPDRPPHVLIAQIWLDAGRIRAKALGSGFGADPAWDMLLDLYVNYHSNRFLSTTSVCRAGAVPNATGLRWLHHLEEEGWIRRSTDPDDRRLSKIGLTAEAIRKIEHALDEAIDGERRLAASRVTNRHPRP